MDRNARSGRNENTFSRNIDSLNSCEVDSLINELKNSVPQQGSGIPSWNRGNGLSWTKENSASFPESASDSIFDEEETFGSVNKEKNPRSGRAFGSGGLKKGTSLSRFSSVCPPGLPVPGKRLQSLMNRVNTVQKRRSVSLDRTGASSWTQESRESFESRTPLIREAGDVGVQSARSDFRDGEPDALNSNIQRCEELLDQLIQSRLPPQPKVPEESAPVELELTESVSVERASAERSSAESVSEESASEESVLAAGHEEREVPSQGVADGASIKKSEKETGREQNETRTRGGKPQIQVQKKTSRLWRGVWLGAEIGCGLLFGVGFVFFLVNARNPIEKRVLCEFQRAVPFATLSCDTSDAVLDQTEMTLGSISAEAVSDQERSQDFQIRKTTLSFYPISRISRSLRLRAATLEGVEFPNLGVSTLSDAWRPTPIAPLFSDEVKTVLADKSNSLESLRYLEKVKEKYLPVYQEISAEVARINSEMEERQASLMTKLKLEKWNPEILKSEEAKRPEAVEELTRIGELRREAIALQSRWMELNQSVATDLAQVREKIVQDGKAFSSILHFAWPTDEVLSEYLFKTDIQKRLAESVNWSSALWQMAEMGMLAHSRYPAEALKTSGNIELFGQNFCFASDWNSKYGDDGDFSYCGTVRLDSDTIPAEYLKDAFVSISGREKDGSLVRTVSARVPLPNEAFTWGDYASLPLHGHAQNATVVLSLTMFKNELSGSLSLELEQVAFDAPEANAEKAAILFKQFEKKVIPAVQIVANVSGTAQEPVLEYSGSVAKDLGPLWEIALQEIHQKTRKEIITAIYEQLKNAETGFNGTLEPFYQEMLVCAQKTDLFKDFPLLKGRISSKAPSREAIVEVVPMNIAHLEVNRIDLDETIPTYDPNLGIAPVSEAVSAPIGNQAVEPSKPIKKSIPVKKVASIEPLPTPVANEEEGEEKAPATVPESVSSGSLEASRSRQTLSETEQSEQSEQASPAPMPNVADPVFYSTKPKKELKPMDIPINRKSSMPLPMMKSTSNFGS